MECGGSPPLLQRNALHQTPIPAPPPGPSLPPGYQLAKQAFVLTTVQPQQKGVRK